MNVSLVDFDAWLTFNLYRMEKLAVSLQYMFSLKSNSSFLTNKLSKNFTLSLFESNKEVLTLRSHKHIKIQSSYHWWKKSDVLLQQQYCSTMRNFESSWGTNERKLSYFEFESLSSNTNVLAKQLNLIKLLFFVAKIFRVKILFKNEFYLYQLLEEIFSEISHISFF